MNLQVLKGSLMGDMWIQKVKNRKNCYSIRFEQSEYEYARWKAEQCNVPFTLKKYKRIDSRNSNTYYRYFVNLTINKKYKELLYNSFYKPKKTSLTKNLVYSLSPLAIAIWYMDDGNLYYNGNNCHLSLSIDNFDDQTKDLIIEFFRDKYQLNFKKTQKHIRLTSIKDTLLFMKIVEKFIPKCMIRKTLKFQKIKYNKTLTDEQRKYRHKKYR